MRESAWNVRKQNFSGNVRIISLIPAICRDSILKAEGKHRDHDIAELSVIHKDLFDFLAKLPGKSRESG